jgi:hypothetical protein
MMRILVGIYLTISISAEGRGIFSRKGKLSGEMKELWKYDEDSFVWSEKLVGDRGIWIPAFAGMTVREILSLPITERLSADAYSALV